MVFVTEDMAMRSTREFRLVLIPAYGIIAAAFGALPIPAVLWLGVHQRNAALLFMATTMFYVVSYEWLHLAYHLPATSAIGRNPLIARLRRHHAVHHAPELMQKWNFNVSIPLWDFVRRTMYRGEIAAATESEPTARTAR
jgi:sterol desaturase/sphingolipid hydroxylase (fatty acid hydroxylase superfamily)